MISVIANDFEKDQEEQNDFYSRSFSYTDDELSAMADDYDANDALNGEQADALAEDNDEGDPDALGTLVFEGESLYDAPHNFVEPKVEQLTTEEEKVEESASIKAKAKSTRRNNSKIKIKKKTKAEQIKKLNEPDNLVLPSTKKLNPPKIFSGFKKGSKGYNKALEEKSQFLLFDF